MLQNATVLEGVLGTP